MNKLEFIFDRAVRLIAAMFCTGVIISLFRVSIVKEDKEHSEDHKLFKFVENLDCGYIYHYFDRGSVIEGPNVNIPPYILNYSFNDRFIIVKQTLNGKTISADYDKYHFIYPSLNGMYYWIIDKENETYYGPLKEEDYINKVDSLYIQLTFDPENEIPIIEEKYLNKQ